jgi:predicted  nucleic acid-binding Zn-ribbon protein
MAGGAETQGLEQRLADLEEQVSKLSDALLQSQLDDWKARIDQLEVQARLGQMEAREQLNPIVEQLRNRWLDARDQLDRAQEAAGDALTTLRSGVRSAMKDLGEAFDEAVGRLRKD